MFIHGGNTVRHHPLPSVTWASTFWYTRHFRSRHFGRLPISQICDIYLQKCLEPKFPRHGHQNVFSIIWLEFILKCYKKFDQDLEKFDQDLEKFDQELENFKSVRKFWNK